MTSEDRREFLKRLAKTALYAAPVIHSMSAPTSLVAQGQSSQHKVKASPYDAGTSSTPTRQPGGLAPGDRQPPGQTKPGSRPPP